MVTSGMNDPKGPDLHGLLGNLERLPALPATASRAISLLSQSGSSAVEIERIFRADEGLAAATLRRANSVGFSGGAKRSFGLKESIARLGNRVLMRIALEQQASNTLRDGGKSYGLERGALWRSALGGAAVAERLAQELHKADPDLCFSAALLRDIGKLAIDSLAGGDRAVGWARQSSAEGVARPFTEVERDRFGADHAEIGAFLAEKWAMPQEIVLAVRYHHLPPDSPTSWICDVVHCADCIARWAGLGLGDDGMCHPLSPRARDTVGIHRERVESLVAYALDFVNTIERDLQQPANGPAGARSSATRHAGEQHPGRKCA